VLFLFLISAVALAFGCDRLGLRSPIGGERFSDGDLIGCYLALFISTYVPFVAFVRLNHFSFDCHISSRKMSAII